MAESTIQANILIDVRKYRLRIYKSTLHELGNPMNIQLLINPVKKHLVIMPVEKKQSGDQALTIGININRPKCSCEVYSKVFITKLCEITEKMEYGHSYHLKGEVIPSQRIALFYLDTLEETKSTGEEQWNQTTRQLS